MQQIVRLVDGVSHQQKQGHPRIVRLEISLLSHLAQHTPVELQATFQMAAKGTAAEHAQLEVITVPTHGICQTCDECIERDIDTLNCPTCGTCDVLWGNTPEVIVKEIEWVEECI